MWCCLSVMGPTTESLRLSAWSGRSFEAFVGKGEEKKEEVLETLRWVLEESEEMVVHGLTGEALGLMLGTEASGTVASSEGVKLRKTSGDLVTATSGGARVCKGKLIRRAKRDQSWTCQIEWSEAEVLARKALRRRGCSVAEARACAGALIDADAEGKPAHGLRRLRETCAAIERGDVRVHADVRVKAKGAVVTVDGGGGLCFRARHIGVKRLMRTAGRFGVGVLFVTRTTSVSGRLAPFVRQLADRGFVALAVVNTPAYLAWPGAKSVKRVLGTNPVAFAVPRHNAEPLVVDMALAAVSRADIEVAVQTGADLPPDVAVDLDGRPTKDPRAALLGAQLPAGGLKGAFLALLVEILAGFLSGSDLATESDDYHTMNRGGFVLAIDTKRLRGPDDAARALVAHLPFIPGTRASAARRLHRANDAIPLALPTFFELAALAYHNHPFRTSSPTSPSPSGGPGGGGPPKTPPPPRTD